MRARLASGFTIPTKRARHDGNAACAANIASTILITSDIAASAVLGLSYRVEVYGA